jgi:hypothetical protein
MTAAVVRATAVISTIMTPIAVLMVVVVALNVRVIAEIVRKKRLYCCVARTADTSIEPDTRIGKCHLRTASDATADKNVCSDCF